MDKTPQKESTGVACIICANVKWFLKIEKFKKITCEKM
jgi:hypothetical protein